MCQDLNGILFLDKKNHPFLSTPALNKISPDEKGKYQGRSWVSLSPKSPM